MVKIGKTTLIQFEIDLIQVSVTSSLRVSTSAILLLAAIEDYLLGDPWGWIHPVQIIGWMIHHASNLALKFCAPGRQRRLAGVFLGLLTITGSGYLGWTIIEYATLIHPLLGFLLQVILLASCFAGKSLRVAVYDVLQPCKTRNLVQARSRLAMYVGRDTNNLSHSQILRALLETVAENSVDGVTAPLFYAVIGGFTPIGVVPLTLAYKASSTLDSMIGYFSEPYKDLGWFSAQLEDRLTWIPCRLSVLTLALFSRNPVRVWNICRRDGIKDPSPNSGWSEAAYAAVLRVQLGGENTYKGVVKQKPLLGDPEQPIAISKIIQALNLTRNCFLIWMAIAILTNFIILLWQ